MLWIEAGNKKRIFHNSPSDDFIRFLPKALNCEPGDIRVWIIANDAIESLKKVMTKQDDYIRVVERQDNALGLSVLQKTNVDGEDGFEVIEQHSFLISPATRHWPYEEKEGKLYFIGLI